MKLDQPIPRNIDEYIDRFPPKVQHVLEKIRATIRKAAPKAEETIKYQIPTFTLNGNLLYFAAYKNHIGVYPAPTGDEKFKKELVAYRSGKSSLRFSLDQPIPYGLISRIVKVRMKEHLERVAAKGKKR